MRENKFRFWDGKTMIYDMCIRDNVGEIRLCSYPGSKAQQFTGLLDKNGKEIYEGDICSLDIPSHYSFSVKNFIGAVTWDKENLSYQILDNEEVEYEWLAEQIDEVEVVGNIYENPELLKGEIA